MGTGNCTCDGNLVTGLEIDCGFSGCAFGDGVGCGEVTLDLNLAQDDDTDADTGVVDIQACTKFNDEFDKACISYAVDMSNEGQLVQTCSASYGDSTCECSIDENSCVTIDCSSILEDAVMDECMPMGMMSTPEDFNTFVPKFRMLVPTVEEEEENIVNEEKEENIVNEEEEEENIVNEEEEEEENVIVKPNKPKKKKFLFNGRRKKCNFVEKMIVKKGKEFCNKPAKKKEGKKMKTVKNFCPAECA